MLETIPDFSDLIYLDNAATSFPKPPEMIENMALFYQNYGASPGRSGFDMSKLASDMVDDTRKQLAHLFGGDDYNKLIFCTNATEALNLAIFGSLNENDHVITTLLEHNSVLRPLNYLIKEKKITVDYLVPGPDGKVCPGQLEDLIKRNTRLVIINHVSNVTGIIQPVAAIGDICRKNEILFLVDAAQSAGHLPLDVNRDKIDFLAFTGHKSLLGPTGTGGLLINSHYPLRSFKMGGTGYNSIDPLQPENLPYKFEAGTLNVLGIAGLHFSLKYLEKQNLNDLHKKQMDLFFRLENALRSCNRAEVYCPMDNEEKMPVINFNFRGMDARTLATILDVDFNIATRKGLHCAPLIHQHLQTPAYGSVRMSLGIFNTEEEINLVINALEQINSGKTGY